MRSFMSRWTHPRRLGTLLLAVGSVWIALLFVQHAIVVKQEELTHPSVTRSGFPAPQAHALVDVLPSDGSKGQGFPTPKMLQRDPLTATATWNGKLSLWLDEAPSKSEIRCVGDDNTEDAWMRRSCHITNLCYSTETHDYVIMGDSDAPHVALGGINPRWDNGTAFNMGIFKVKWKPQNAKTSTPVYRFDDSLVLLPFHSLAGHNVGHLLWDDFYPMVSLARLFGLLEDPWRLLPIRHQLTDNHTLYASCDIRRNKRQQCAANLAKFASMLGQDPDVLSTPNRWVKVEASNGSVQSSLVCAKNALVGLGFLTDHGWKDHGWNDEIERESVAWPLVPHNLGRGRDFEVFRSFVLRNLGVQDVKATTSQQRVSFSLQSSRDWDRRLNFTHQIAAVSAALGYDSGVSINAYTLWNMTLEEQVQLATSSDVWVTSCGGGSMTATFLPTGASLIVFYNPAGGFDFRSYKLTGHPARLDWDLLNNAAHLRVHWLPVSTMNDNADLELLVELIRHELRSKRVHQ